MGRAPDRSQPGPRQFHLQESQVAHTPAQRGWPCRAPGSAFPISSLAITIIRRVTGSRPRPHPECALASRGRRRDQSHAVICETRRAANRTRPRPYRIDAVTGWWSAWQTQDPPLPPASQRPQLRPAREDSGICGHHHQRSPSAAAMRDRRGQRLASEVWRVRRASQDLRQTEAQVYTCARESSAELTASPGCSVVPPTSVSSPDST